MNGINKWNRAKQIMPGGTQLLSKRSEMFLPDQWVSYFSKAKGIDVWDLDGKKYIDMSSMGVGSCVLGYADDNVNAAVKKVIDSGSMCTLNSPEEVELAELLLSLHPWAGMVRFARTGGESMAIAVRIARAFSKKDRVAFCGYHGWSDWYLSANLADDKALDGHLLEGLAPNGVPRCLKGSSIPFNYNHLEELENIVSKYNDIGVIVVEPVRHHDPEPGFLEGVRKIADKIGAVLIFDEITTGWRMCLGGVYSLYGVTPDIVVYAKAMGNGFPIAAIIGKKSVMNAAQTSFISSTMWTERVGPAAAIATINKLKKYDVYKHLIKIGNLISENWKSLAKKNNLSISVVGIPPLITFTFNHCDSQILHTIFTQEMLRFGYLASKSVYVSYSHTAENISKYMESVDKVFSLISDSIRNDTYKNILEGPVAHKGFQRLT